MINNRFQLSIAIAIGASALTVVMLILKLFGVPLEWVHLLIPLAMVGGVWVVTLLVLVGVDLVLLVLERIERE